MTLSPEPASYLLEQRRDHVSTLLLVERACSGPYQPELKLKFARPSVAALGFAGQTLTLRLLDKTTAGKYLAGHGLAASELVGSFSPLG